MFIKISESNIFNQQSKTQTLFIYCHKRQRKAADTHFQEVETSKCWKLFVSLHLSINWLIISALAWCEW